MAQTITCARILTWLNYWTSRGKLDSWEVMISRELENALVAGELRLSNPDAWTLHPVARGKEYIDASTQNHQLRLNKGSSQLVRKVTTI